MVGLPARRSCAARPVPPLPRCQVTEGRQGSTDSAAHRQAGLFSLDKQMNSFEGLSQ